MNISEKARQKFAEIRGEKNKQQELKELVEEGICPSCGGKLTVGRSNVILKSRIYNRIISEWYTTWECPNECKYDDGNDCFRKFTGSEKFPMGEGYNEESSSDDGKCYRFLDITDEKDRQTKNRW